MLQSSGGVPTNRGADYILIAMANTARAAALRAVALEFSATIVIARDGQDALQQIDRNGAPRLLITDLSLPRVDGFGVIRHLRRLAPPSRAGALVLSPHEAFRAAARKLADSLGISRVLAPDIERPPLRRAMAAAMGEPDGLPPPPRRAYGTPPIQTERPSLDETINRSLFDATRQFCVPMAAALLQVRGERQFASCMSLTDASTAIDWSTVTELLPLAVADEALVVPDLDGHPIFGSPRATTIRGFAGVPLVSPGGSNWGAMAVFDVKPLALASDEIDALAAFARDLACHVEQHFGTPSELPSKTERHVEELEQLAATDPLTGLANRRGCEKAIAGEISRAERERKPLSCLLFDIDRFKQVNDTLGHQAGDQVLRELSAMLRRSVRAYDIVARWGGEEFLLVLPGADIEAARLLAERVRIGVQKLPTSALGGVTVSAGAAQFDSDYDFETTLRAADRRLYEAKAAGRNCVV